MPNTSRRSFGELERSLLDVMWTDAGAWWTVREVHDSVSASRDVAYTTVMTVLDRMARKGLLRQEKAGRAYRYQARSTRAEMTADLMRETLDDVAQHDRGEALVAFVGDATPDELDALRAALARLEGDGRQP